MSLKLLSDYTLYAKYAQYVPNKQRRETWEEMVTRVFDMHARKYTNQLQSSPELVSEFNFAKQQVLKKRVLGAQRALQFGGDPIFKHETRLYNCCASHVDRARFFSESVYLLMAGCGVGFSVQKHHVKQLPNIINRDKGVKVFVAPDSIEGWADSVAVLVSSFFEPINTPFPEYSGYEVQFDLTNIRPEGTLVAGQFKAPGPKPLSKGLAKIRKVFEKRLIDPNFKVDDFANKLRPINAYDVIMHSSDMIISGGIRRSACIALFSFDDEEMMNAKTGNWFSENSQRGRSNNSVILLRNNTTQEQFDKIIQSTKEFGEPGFIWVDDLELCVNPCAEISLFPKTEDGRSGWELCNLSEINGKFCDTEEKFYQCCRAAAIIGTLQAGFTNFVYLSPETKEIVEREALIGVSITGVMDNPVILLSPEVQRKGAQIVKETNEKIAKLIGINPSARCCTIKPAGSTSCILGTSSGIHPHHASRYIRRVQANILEYPVQHFEQVNPLAVEPSVWSPNHTDKVISFLCEVPRGSKIKNDLSAIELLKQVKSTQQNWVVNGTNIDRCVNKHATHNVSNTITVHESEWDEVAKFIYENRQHFTGVSLLPASGDLDYAQAPFTTVLNPKELIEAYGDATLFASGLIVDGLAAFDNNLWLACDTVLGRGEVVPTQEQIDAAAKQIEEIYSKPVTVESVVLEGKLSLITNQQDKTDWIRRANQFADRYFNGDVRKMTYCLKGVSNWKLWVDLKRVYKPIDWSTVTEQDPGFVNVDTIGAQGCSGGKCEIL